MRWSSRYFEYEVRYRSGYAPSSTNTAYKNVGYSPDFAYRAQEGFRGEGV